MLQKYDSNSLPWRIGIQKNMTTKWDTVMRLMVFLSLQVMHIISCPWFRQGKDDDGLVVRPVRRATLASAYWWFGIFPLQEIANAAFVQAFLCTVLAQCCSQRRMQIRCFQELLTSRFGSRVFSRLSLARASCEIKAPFPMSWKTHNAVTSQRCFHKRLMIKTLLLTMRIHRIIWNLSYHFLNKMKAVMARIADWCIICMPSIRYSWALKWEVRSLWSYKVFNGCSEPVRDTDRMQVHIVPCNRYERILSRWARVAKEASRLQPVWLKRVQSRWRGWSEEPLLWIGVQAANMQRSSRTWARRR